MGFLSRQPFALLGALGLISLVQDLLQWQEQIGLWIDAWQAVTRPIIQFLFGWIPALLKLPFPWWAQDYLVFGVISVGSLLRFGWASGLSSASTQIILLFFGMLLLVPFLWPIALPAFFAGFFEGESGESPDQANWRTRMFAVFLESYVWAALIIAVNYALLFAGTR